MRTAVKSEEVSKQYYCARTYPNELLLSQDLEAYSVHGVTTAHLEKVSQKKDVEELSEDSSVTVSSGETEEEWEEGTDDHTGDESDYDDDGDDDDEDENEDEDDCEVDHSEDEDRNEEDEDGNDGNDWDDVNDDSSYQFGVTVFSWFDLG